MSRTAAICALLVCAALVGIGCARSMPIAPTSSTTPARPNVVVLTAEQPTARIPQPRTPGASGVQLDLLTVTNPGGQGLAISLALEDAPTAARRVVIGSVSPYPSDQPGVFTLALPGPAAELARQGPTLLVVTVAPALSGTALQPGASLRLTARLTGPDA